LGDARLTGPLTLPAGTLTINGVAAGSTIEPEGGYRALSAQVGGRMLGSVSEVILENRLAASRSRAGAASGKYRTGSKAASICLTNRVATASDASVAR